MWIERDVLCSDKFTDCGASVGEKFKLVRQYTNLSSRLQSRIGKTSAKKADICQWPSARLGDVRNRENFVGFELVFVLLWLPRWTVSSSSFPVSKQSITNYYDVRIRMKDGTLDC